MGFQRVDQAVRPRMQAATSEFKIQDERITTLNDLR